MRRGRRRFPRHRPTVRRMRLSRISIGRAVGAADRVPEADCPPRLPRPVSRHAAAGGRPGRLLLSRWNRRGNVRRRRGRLGTGRLVDDIAAPRAAPLHSKLARLSRASPALGSVRRLSHVRLPRRCILRRRQRNLASAHGRRGGLLRRFGRRSNRGNRQITSLRPPGERMAVGGGRLPRDDRRDARGSRPAAPACVARAVRFARPTSRRCRFRVDCPPILPGAPSARTALLGRPPQPGRGTPKSMRLHAIAAGDDRVRGPGVQAFQSTPCER